MNWVSLIVWGKLEHISETTLGTDETLFTTLCGKSGYCTPGAEMSFWYTRYGGNPPWSDSDCQECKRIYLLIKNL